MAFIQRFSTINRGGIRFIGNTLGLSKASNSNTAGTQGSIGAFTTLTNSQVASFPQGTTLNYALNGSNAILNLPVGSTILYAELVWGGLYKSQTQDISALINNSITFTANGQDFSVSPDNATSQTFLIPTNNFNVGFYVRSANVTSIMSNFINGTFSASGIPALVIPLDNQTADTNHAGWTLAVVYQNNSEVLRNLTLWVGGAVVGPNTPVTDVTLSGFLTPQVFPINGKAFLSAQEGDAVLTGDQFLFGKDAGSLSVMSGPNNPARNFFCSQINDENGVIDTTGTFGTRNANAQAGTNISAGRQGWDITAVDISSKLETSQTSALLRFTSDGDLYVPNALATQIDSLGASLEVTKSVDDIVKLVGEEINYTISIKNSGQLEANSIEVSDFIPDGLTLVPNSIFVDGVQVSDTLPITIASLPAGDTTEITYKLIANSIPLTNPAVNIASVKFNFQPFEGYNVEVTSLSNAVLVAIIEENVVVIKTVDKTIAKKGDTLLYTSYVYNNGSLTAQNIVFKDTIPQGSTFVENSVTIDNIFKPLENPEVGINLGTLLPKETRIVSFMVTVN